MIPRDLVIWNQLQRWRMQQQQQRQLGLLPIPYNPFIGQPQAPLVSPQAPMPMVSLPCASASPPTGKFDIISVIVTETVYYRDLNELLNSIPCVIFVSLRAFQKMQCPPLSSWLKVG